MSASILATAVHGCQMQQLATKVWACTAEPACFPVKKVVPSVSREVYVVPRKDEDVLHELQICHMA